MRDDRLKARELVLHEEGRESVRSMQSEGERHTRRDASRNPHESERSSPADLLSEEREDERNEKEDIRPPGHSESQKERRCRFPSLRCAKQKPEKGENGDAIGRQIAPGDDLLQEHGREDQKAPEKEQRLSNIT